LSLNHDRAEALLASLKEDIQSPRNSEEVVVSQVGRALYEAFYLNYTIKQWGLHPSRLRPSVCARIPVRLNRDDRYFDAPFQMLPANGYTAMMGKMIEHPNIRVLLNCDFTDIRDLVDPRHATVYSGPLDEYFAHRLGKLPYRSLRFEYVTEERPWAQPCVQVNYPNNHDYTRTVEYKHLHPSSSLGTVVGYEFPCSTGDPFYPIPSTEHERLADKYSRLAAVERAEKRVYFAGRLAEYRYLNMDQVIDRAFEVFKEICRDVAKKG
jgi:UDP-galactopyranose mutase